MSSDHNDGSTNFTSSLALLKHEVNTWYFIFQGIWWWPIINLVTFIHGYSLEVVIGYWKVSFQETQANLNRLHGKPDVKYPSRNF